MPGRASLTRHIQRLSRFLDNGAVRVREWYEPLAPTLIEGLLSRVRTKNRDSPLATIGRLIAGQRLWLPNCLLTKQYAYTVNLLAYWKPSEKSPWLLATHLPTAQVAWVAYRRRLGIEEMFGDFKGHGFHLEATHL